MEVKILKHEFSICKVDQLSLIDWTDDFCFVSKTDEELSLVCQTHCVPEVTLEREDGWRAFRIQGVLDFSLVGILSKISTALAKNEIGIFAISTYNTDYILVKEANFPKAVQVLSGEGYYMIG